MPEPSWLQPMIDQRLALMVHKMGEESIKEMVQDGVMIMTTLTEPSEHATEVEKDYWERSCDNCGRYVGPEDADGVKFMTGHKQMEWRGVNVIITFGACTWCAVPDEVPDA